ncbi:MAG TPA: GNAT family N-acetyltransferase [Blastocatellia bacterium]|nr:GNAT family N-acetyltransferase [Blastocatellia bacterium]
MNTNLPSPCSLNVGLQEVRELREADRERVLSLLAQDPVRSVILRGLILDYGMCAPELRGVFYGYFTGEQLTDLALIGHQLIVFANDEALPALAQKAVDLQARLHMILGPEHQVEKLWGYLAQHERETRRMSAQRLYVCQEAGSAPERRQLLRANYAELDVVTDAQAEMALEASGVDPRQNDLAGFRHRIVERLERKRIWVKIEDGKVVFKADIFSDTPDTVYLEGIWTHPNYRNRGIAKSCMAELLSRLLCDHQTICLFTDETEQAAQSVYEHVGFNFVANYQARFLAPLAPAGT